MSYESSVIILAVALLGAVGGYLLRILISLGRRGSMELEIKRQLLNAKEQVKKIVAGAEEKAQTIRDDAEREVRERQEASKKNEERVRQREALLDHRQIDLDNEEEQLKQKSFELETQSRELEEVYSQANKNLEQISRMSQQEALVRLYAGLEEEYGEDLMVRTQKLEHTGRKYIQDRAKEILTATVQRLANSLSSDLMTTTITLPTDEVKGKIIGKEGRNIRTFERVSGVELVVDDTPGVITLSSFDPVRRHVAHVALENLIKDGRIQPAKIEEAVEKAENEINQMIKEKGEEAVYECGIYNLDPRIVSILGRLYFRTSYGQNILQHSIEVSHLAGLLAEEIGASVTTARAAGLLHDIGKALDHQVAGTHVEIGRRILLKFGSDQDVITAMQAHHEEYPYESLEAMIVQSADAISGARPGARRDTADHFLQRLSELEAIANSYPAVERSYALQAGREVRVFIHPEDLSDYRARELAREIAIRIENELKYPGEIKVNVIRESRAIEFAR